MKICTIIFGLILSLNSVHANPQKLDDSVNTGEWWRSNKELSNCTAATGENLPAALMKTSGCSLDLFNKDKDTILIVCKKRVPISFARTKQTCEDNLRKFWLGVSKELTAMKWVIKNGKTCFRAEGDFSLASIMGSFPECYKENPQDSVKGIFILNCEKSELHNSMMFTES